MLSQCTECFLIEFAGEGGLGCAGERGPQASGGIGRKRELRDEQYATTRAGLERRVVDLVLAGATDTAAPAAVAMSVTAPPPTRSPMLPPCPGS